MAVSHRALLETRDAFDAVAPTYDRSNSENLLLRAIRSRTIAAVTAYAPRGAWLLDLGCGPGPDAVRLARLGYRVMAIDWSSAMVREARARVAREGLDNRIEVRHLGIHELDVLAGRTFSGAYADLGPLNCVPDLADAARLIAARLDHGGMLVASVIGRVCPWELALYGLRRNWRRAAIRFASGSVPVPLNGRTVWTSYYTLGEFAKAFAAAGFVRVVGRALGLLTPPPYLQAFAERHPALVGRLQALEDRLAAWPGLPAWGDHFLVVLRKI